MENEWLPDTVTEVLEYFKTFQVGHVRWLGSIIKENCIYHGTEAFFFLGLHSRHMEVPRIGVESELQLAQSNTGSKLHL